MVKEKINFNTFKNSYCQTIEESISIFGQKLDFYTRTKATTIQRIFNQQRIRSPTILDIGCGHGLIHPMLTNLGCKVTGVETATEVIKLAKKTNPNVSYCSYDGEKLPFNNMCFDFVLIICVIHHVNPIKWISFLKEARRVLRNEGQVIIFEHNPINPITRFVVSKNIIDKDAVLLSSKKLSSLLLISGYRFNRSRFILFTPFSNFLIKKIETFFEWLPLGAQYCITAKA